jgi:hypothetical protein
MEALEDERMMEALEEREEGLYYQSTCTPY